MTSYVFGQKKQRVSVVLYEEFTGDGSDTTFQLTSSPDNATWLSGHGAWAAANIHTTYPAHITKTNKKPIYDSVIPLTRNTITVSSISAEGLVTLDYAPRNNADFYIWYWHQLSTDDILSAYHRVDYVASMEGEMIGTINLYDTDSSNVLTLAWAEDSSNDRTLNLAGLVGGDRTFTLNESLTIGNGYDGTITFSAASKTLTVADDCTVNQDLQTTDTPILAGLIIADGGTIGQAAGPLLTFDDTNNYLKITGCDVCIGPTAPGGLFEVFETGSGRTRGSFLVDEANDVVSVGRLSSTGGDSTAYFRVRDRNNVNLFEVDVNNGLTVFKGKLRVIGLGGVNPTTEMVNVSDHAWHFGVFTTEDKFSFARTDVVDYLTIDNVAKTIVFDPDSSSGKVIFSQGSVSIGAGATPLAKLHIDQSVSDAAIPVMILDQADVSEQCIKFSSDSTDRDINLFTIDVNGTPTMMWDESEDGLSWNKNLDMGSNNITSVGTIGCGVITSTGLNVVTVAPVAEIEATASADSTLRLTRDGWSYQIQNDAGYLDFDFSADNTYGSLTHLMRLDGNAIRVGINTASPQELLHLLSAGSAILEIEESASADSTLLLTRNGWSWRIQNDGGLLDFDFNADNTFGSPLHTMRLDDSGNVDIVAHDGAGVGLHLGGNPVTITPAELNLLDGAVLKQKVIDIGDWNMHQSNGGSVFVNVAHGLTLADIRKVFVMIRIDADDVYYPLDYAPAGSAAGYFNVDATNVKCTANNAAIFDQTLFDSTSYNRGWITIWYV